MVIKILVQLLYEVIAFLGEENILFSEEKEFRNKTNKKQNQTMLRSIKEKRKTAKTKINVAEKRGKERMTREQKKKIIIKVEMYRY